MAGLRPKTFAISQVFRRPNGGFTGISTPSVMKKARKIAVFRSFSSLLPFPAAVS